MTFLGYQTVGALGRIIQPALLLKLVYTVVFFNFLSIYLITSPTLLAGLFLLDSFLFCTSPITGVLLRFMVSKREILADVATGMSLYHLGSVIMPALGGYMYQAIHAQVFLLGSAFALCSVVITSFLVFPQQEVQTK